MAFCHNHDIHSMELSPWLPSLTVDTGSEVTLTAIKILINVIV